MNTWLVGHVPVGHYQHNYASPKKTPTGLSEQGSKTFFLKARIMAGQADVSKSVFGDQQFQWLTKAEIEPLVTPKYWSSIKNMLVER